MRGELYVVALACFALIRHLGAKLLAILPPPRKDRLRSVVLSFHDLPLNRAHIASFGMIDREKDSLPQQRRLPLCKGSWRRRRLRDCLFEYQLHPTIPPSRFACHLPLHKGGFRIAPMCVRSTVSPSTPKRKKDTATEIAVSFLFSYAFFLSAAMSRTFLPL